MSEIYEMNIDEIEKYIIGKKIKDMSLEEIKTGINIMSISCCANKKRKSGGGYLWHFV